MKMTNGWNRIVYRLWAPIYDSTVGPLFLPGRKRALELLGLQPAERVLLVGVGTGEDLPLLPASVHVTGLDLSPQMLARARLKDTSHLASLKLIEGDALLPLFDDAGFDAATLNLILSVVPDGNACLRSTLRALKPGGRAVIFDKFLPEGVYPSAGRRLINLFSRLFGTDINRRLKDILQNCPCEVILNEPSLGNGLYRVVLISKSSAPSP